MAADYLVEYASIKTPTIILGALPVSTFAYSDALNAPGAISGTMPLNPYPDSPTLFTPSSFIEGGTVLYVKRDGVTQWGGILWSWQADLAADTLSFAGEGWHSYMRRRIITSTLSYAAADQDTIARSLITTPAFDYGGNDLGIHTAANPHGVPRDRTYYWWDGKDYGTTIEELAAVDGGFDFRYVTSTDGAGLYRIDFVTQYPATGRSTTLVFELGVNVAGLSYTSNAKDLTNYQIGFGSGQGQATLLTTAVTAPSILTYPLLQAVASFPEVIELGTLTTNVRRNLVRSVTPARLIDLEVYAGTVPVLGSYDVGDRCAVTAKRGFVQLDREPYRITAKEIAVDDVGGETVRLSLAPIGMFA